MLNETPLLSTYDWCSTTTSASDQTRIKGHGQSVKVKHLILLSVVLSGIFAVTHSLHQTKQCALENMRSIA